MTNEITYGILHVRICVCGETGRIPKSFEGARQMKRVLLKLSGAVLYLCDEKV